MSRKLFTNKLTTSIVDLSDEQLRLNAKQAQLISGVNISTINGASLLSGTNINLQTPLVSGASIKTVSGQSLLGAGDISLKTINSTSLVGSTDLTISQLGGLQSSQLNQPNGVSGLDNFGKVLKSALPSLSSSDVGLQNVNNTSDIDKPISNATQSVLNSKQNMLVSGTNIKSINSQSLLGSGDLSLSTPADLLTKQDKLVSGTNIKTINGVNLLTSGDIAVSTPADLASKQNTLISGTNIVTINNQSMLGSGNLNVQPTLVSGTSIQTINGNSILVAGNLTLATQSALSTKQDALVSGTNIKTINSTTLLGTGDLSLQPLLVSGTNVKTVNGASILGSGDLNTSFSISALSPNFDLNYYLCAWYRCDGNSTQNFVLSGSNVQQWYSLMPHGAPILQITPTASAPTLNANGVSTGNACISFTSSQGMGGTNVIGTTNITQIATFMPQSIFTAYDNHFCITMMVNLSWIKSTYSRKQCVLSMNNYYGNSPGLYTGLRTSCFFKDLYYWDKDQSGSSISNDLANGTRPMYLPSNQWFCLTLRSLPNTANKVFEVLVNNHKIYQDGLFSAIYSFSLTIPFLYLNGYYLFLTTAVGTWYQYGSTFQIREMKEYRSTQPIDDNEVATIVADMHSRAGISMSNLTKYNITQGYLLMRFNSANGVNVYTSTTQLSSWVDMQNSISFTTSSQSLAPTIVQNVFGTIPGINFTTTQQMSIVSPGIDLPPYGPFAVFFVFKTPATITTTSTGFFRFSITSGDCSYQWLLFPSTTTIVSSIISNTSANTSRTAPLTVAANTKYVMAVFLSRYGANALVMSSGYTQKSVVTGQWVVNNYSESLNGVTFTIGSSQSLILGEIRFYYAGTMSNDHIQTIFTELSTTYGVTLL